MWQACRWQVQWHQWRQLQGMQAWVSSRRCQQLEVLTMLAASTLQLMPTMSMQRPRMQQQLTPMSWTSLPELLTAIACGIGGKSQLHAGGVSERPGAVGFLGWLGVWLVDG
mmetsp:Transcript_36375/g.91852  ORF Transcript_36375/g.91852 Transcript_36375/m.91852 type:complete len:111 (-) Transcript_36375:545-877(-)